MEIEVAIPEAFRGYDRARLHSAPKRVPPDEFLASWETEHKRGTRVCKNVQKAVSSFGVHPTDNPHLVPGNAQIRAAPYVDMHRKDLGGLIRLVPLKDLQRFIESEIKKDAGVERRFLSRFGGLDGAPRVDYREQAEIMFADVDYMTPYQNRLRFGDFFKAAKARERRGQAAEAIRIYLEVSEAIRSNYNRVDDSSGHYAEAFHKAVTEMAACIGRQKAGPEKRPHISYLHRQFLTSDLDMHEGVYEQALISACTDRQDLEYLRGLNEQALPEGPVSKRAGDYYRVLDRILLQTEVLEKMGESAAAAELFDKHYRGSIDICGAYVEMLIRRGDLAQTRAILEEARNIFPEREFGYISSLADGAAG